MKGLIGGGSSSSSSVEKGWGGKLLFSYTQENTGVLFSGEQLWEKNLRRHMQAPKSCKLPFPVFSKRPLNKNKKGQGA